MAELNLKQITDKLNSEFASDVRKLVFWYDTNADFQEDIDSIELENAKVLHLEPDNQFYIKYFLEREDTTTNYLVYAPFAKPSIENNHLADTIRYSKEFFADRASLLTIDLGIDERYKPVIQHYIKFFANKDRTQKFYDLEKEFHSIFESFTGRFRRAKSKLFENPYLEGVSLAFPYLERRKAIFIDCVVFGTNVEERRSAAVDFLRKMGHNVEEVRSGSETLLKIDGMYYRIFPATRRSYKVPIQGVNLVPVYW